MTSRNSTMEPGQPCMMSSGKASAWLERAWMKWIDWPSMRVRKCASSLSRASCARQSYLSRQYSTSSRTESTGVPYSQPVPSIWSGNRVCASRRRRSESTASSTWIRNLSIASLIASSAVEPGSPRLLVVDDELEQVRVGVPNVDAGALPASAVELDGPGDEFDGGRRKQLPQRVGAAFPDETEVATAGQRRGAPELERGVLPQGRRVEVDPLISEEHREERPLGVAPLLGVGHGEAQAAVERDHLLRTLCRKRHVIEGCNGHDSPRSRRDADARRARSRPRRASARARTARAQTPGSSTSAGPFARISAFWLLMTTSTRAIGPRGSSCRMSVTSPSRNVTSPVSAGPRYFTSACTTKPCSPAQLVR